MIAFFTSLLMKFGLDRLDAGKWARRAVLVLALLLILMIALFFGWLFNSCKIEPSIDEENLQKINSSIDQRRDAEIEKILVENELIEKSVNDRTAESEARLKRAEEKVREAREFNGKITAEELKKILEETK